MNKTMEVLKRILLILIGTGIYAFGLHYFLLPGKFMEGGLTGVSILLYYAIGLPLSISVLILNIPLFIIGWRALGRTQMIYTFVGTVFLSGFLALFELFIGRGWLVPFTSEGDSMLAALYAGATMGLGLGIVFRSGGTTGGIDIVARMMLRWKGVSMGQTILTLDAFIIGAALFYIPLDKVLYTLVIVFIATKLIDFIQEGAYSAKAFTIISVHGEEIARRITHDMERGVTLMPAIGAFSGQHKQVVYCVVQRHEVRRMHNMIRSIDPKAFCIVNEVRDVWGEGFQQE